MTFGQVKKEVVAWLNDSSMGVQIPSFVTRAQRKLERLLRIRALEYQPANGTLTAATKTIALPSDYIELIYLAFRDGNTRYTVDERRSVREFVERNNSIATSHTGRPTEMMRLGDNLVFDRYADQNYTYEYAYYRHLTALSADTDSNWWTTNADELLISASLVQAIPYLRSIERQDMRFKDDPRWRTWIMWMNDMIEDIRRVESREQTSGKKVRTTYHEM